MRLLRDWTPPVLWTTLILLASSDLFSAPHTGSFLESFLTSLFGRPLSPETFEMLHFLIRKCAHLTEYGILGALLFRALRSGRDDWRWSWAGSAVVIAASIASIDEWHQTFVPTRTGTPKDVLIDTIGAALAQLIWAAVDSRFIRKKRYANNHH